MSISPYNPHDRYRARFRSRMAGFVVFALIVGVSGAIGFWVGQQMAAQKVKYLEEKIAVDQKQTDMLQSALTELRAEAQTAAARLVQMQEAYQETVPAGPMQDLMPLLRQQLEEGMDPARLEFALRSARPPQNCTEPETRRFVISTPAYTGSDSQISIDDAAVVIHGSGVSAQNDQGLNEAWYDPAKKVSLEFTLVSGAVEKKEGIMPMSHSVVAGEREYRFTIEEGARSFAKVTFDSCDYP